jgi:hypothetical protein
VRRGVVAWAHAWPAQPAPARAARPATPVAVEDGGELVGVLASMAVARLAA